MREVMMFQQYVVATNFAQNAGTWLLEQLFWIGLSVMAGALIGCLIKKNYTGSVITVIAGGVILYFVKSPQTIYDIGTKLAQIFISGS